MRRSGVWGMTAMLLVGLAGPASRAKEPPRTEPARGRDFWGWLPWRGKKEVKPAPLGDVTVRAVVPEEEDPAQLRAREEAEFFRREEICTRLMDIALQNEDMTLYKKAEELQNRAWRLYLRRTSHLKSTRIALETDEQLLQQKLRPVGSQRRLAEDRSGPGASREASVRPASSGREKP